MACVSKPPIMSQSSSDLVIPSPFWQNSGPSSGSASPLKGPVVEDELKSTRASSRSQTAASSARWRSSDKEEHGSGSDEDAGQGGAGEADRLEQKRAKNRVKQRNLRQRRAEHISALEHTTDTLHSDLAYAQSMVSKLQHRESHLQSWVRDLETALFRHGMSSEVEILRRVWALPPVSGPLSNGGVYPNRDRPQDLTAASTPDDKRQKVNTLTQPSNAVVSMSGSPANIVDRSQHINLVARKPFAALSDSSSRAQPSSPSTSISPSTGAFQHFEVQGGALQRMADGDLSSPDDHTAKRRRSTHSGFHNHQRVDQQSRRSAQHVQVQQQHLPQEEQQQRGPWRENPPTAPWFSSDFPPPLAPYVPSNEAAAQRSKTVPHNQDEQQLVARRHPYPTGQDRPIFPATQSTASSGYNMLPTLLPPQQPASVAASPKAMRIEDLLSPMGNQPVSEERGEPEDQLLPKLEPGQDAIQRLEETEDGSASIESRPLPPFGAVPDMTFAESPSSDWLSEALFQQVTSSAAYEGFPMIDNTRIAPEIDFHQLGSLLADQPQEVFPLYQANSEGATYMYPFGVDAAPPAYQEQAHLQPPFKQIISPLPNTSTIVTAPPVSPNINAARQLLLALLPMDCDLKPPIRLPILTPGQQIIILQALADLSPLATQTLFLSRQLRSLPAPLAKLLLSYQASPQPDERIVLLPIAILRARVIQLHSFGVSLDITALVQGLLQHGRIFGDPLDPEGWELPGEFWDAWGEHFPPGRAYCGSLTSWRRRDGHRGSSVAEMILGMEPDCARRVEPVGWPIEWQLPDRTLGRDSQVVPILKVEG